MIITLKKIKLEKRRKAEYDCTSTAVSKSSRAIAILFSFALHRPLEQ